MEPSSAPEALSDPPSSPPASESPRDPQSKRDGATPRIRLARSAGLVGVATMTSRALGVVREQVLAYAFGASDVMDAFNVAFRLPNLMRDLFAEGAMSAAFVPTFTRHLAQRGKNEAWRLGARVMSALIVVTALLVVLAMVFADQLVWLYASEYAAVPGKLELTTELTRVMFPFLTLVAVAVAMMGMLNAIGYFFVPSLSPALFNVATILSVFLIVPLMPRFGWHPTMGLAIGVLLGGLAQVAVQWPLLERQGFRFRFELAPRDPGLREVLLLLGPGTLGVAAMQINLFVSTYLATSQGTGAVASLAYAFRLMYLPIGLFGVSIATAVVPALSQHAARDDIAALRRTFSHAVRLTMMLNVPASVGLMTLATPIVALLYERGAFTSSATTTVALALMAYAPGLIGYSTVKVASPTFYALRDSRTPATVSVVAVAANVVFSITLVRMMGFVGLALGTALASLVNGGVLFWLLRRRLHGIDGRRIAVAFVKILAASLVMGGAAWLVQQQFELWLPGRALVRQLVRVLGSIGVALAVLLACSKLLRIKEFDEAFGSVTRRVLARLRP
ncbi:MAG: murein biosynthesis integral membrane protein MurJ [Luteitalea sp.]|nr:murein biosynthesis integral membrane protein MurJ [Luteitalea sp.]